MRPALLLPGTGVSSYHPLARGFLSGVLTAALLALAVSGLPAPAAAKVKFEGWSGKPPPEGRSSENYSPGGIPPGGGDDYNPTTDPNHPLKNPTEDPGEEWEGAHGGGGLGSTQLPAAKGDIDWGEQYYEGKFNQPIQVDNQCEKPQAVSIFVNGPPYLTLPPMVFVPPGKTVIQGQVELPPEPAPPIRTGAPGEPGWGHVDFGPIIIPAGMFPPPDLHQPNFAQVTGEVVLWHSWTGICKPKRVTYSVTGHIHFRPPPPPRGPEKIAGADVCTLWWNIGEEPAQHKDEDCEDKIRELAGHFIQKILAHYISNDPEKWNWLPTVAEIGVMSIPEMLMMKTVAEGVLGHKPASNPPKQWGWPPAGEKELKAAQDKGKRDALLFRAPGNPETGTAPARLEDGSRIKQRLDPLK